MQTIILSEQQALLPLRSREAHKGNFGHVLVVGGDQGMAGAVRLAGEAALRVGAGLVSVVTRAENIASVNAGRPELMCHTENNIDLLMQRATVIVIGPGLGQQAWGQSLLEKILRSDLPLVVDADALNLLAKKSDSNLLKRNHWVLTPHPGEAARLLNISHKQIQANRSQYIEALQKKFSGVIILKGADTLVRGEQAMTYICKAGNPGMASGGMGDVLSGVVAGLIAQGLSLLDAAKTGVSIHAHAGDRAANKGERGLLASDLFIELRRLVNPC